MSRRLLRADLRIRALLFASDDSAQAEGAEPAGLRERLGVAPGGFAFRLVGKDCGVRRRAAGPVSLKAIFDPIDAMPMRQAEMRERGETPR